MATEVTAPFEIFRDTNGEPLENGQLYVGVSNLEPSSNQVQIYWDAALSIPATQPIRTISGYTVRQGTPSEIFLDDSLAPYSIKVLDKNSELVYSSLQEYGQIYNIAAYVRKYASVAALKLVTLNSGDVATTESYYSATGSTKAQGGGSYQVVTPAEFTVITGLGAADGYIDHNMAGGNVAMLMGRSEPHVSQCGAVDGVDSTIQIQALVNTMTSTSGGMIIDFTNGDWVVDTLTITAKFGLQFRGAAGSAFSTLQVKTKIACTNLGDFRCYGLKFVGNAFSLATRTVSAPTAGNYCFDMLDNIANWDIQACDFVGFDVAFRPDPAAANTGSYVININNNYFQSNNYDCEGGIVLHFTMSDNTFAETITGNAKLSRASEFHYENNKHENGVAVMTSYNVELYNSSKQDCKSVITGNTWHEFSGIRLNNVDGVCLDNNQSRLHSTADLVGILVDGTTENIYLGQFELNGFQGGAAFATTGVHITGTAANIYIHSAFKCFNFVTALLSDNGNLVRINNATLIGNTTGLSVQGQSVANRFSVKNTAIQGGTDAILSTSNTAEWNEQECDILSGAVTNTDGYLERYYETGTWTPAPTGLTVVGTPTYTGTYTKIGNVYHCYASISSTTSTAATAGTTFFAGIPATAATDSTVQSVTTGALQGSVGLVTGTFAYTGTWTAVAAVRISFTYEKA